MTFQFYLFSFTSIVHCLPNVLLAVLSNIHLVKIGNQPAVDIIASVDVEVMAEDDSNMVRPAGDVFTFDFDFSPAVVEGVFELRLDDEAGTLLLVDAGFIGVEIFGFFASHQLSNQ